jgi:hypothetical protein
MGNYGDIDIMVRIEQQAYKLRHRRQEGFDDGSLESKCIVHEIKWLFRMLSPESQTEILDKPWLD